MGVFLFIGFSSQLFSNLYRSFIIEEYVIPKESSLFTFKATLLECNGDAWLYGEDNTSYYTTLLKKEAGYSGKYFVISKEKASKLSEFHKHHYSTWFEVYIECGGIFTEKLLFDDGIDLYSKWNASIDFKDDKCSKGTFTGILGHIMPESTYNFIELDSCTFQHLVDKASKRWNEEYEKRKN